MVGMSKKRKFGSPANKSVVNEEEVCGIGQVMREDGSRKVTGRQIDSKDTKDTTGDRTGGYRRKAGAGVRHSSNNEDRISEDMTNEERREHVTRSGRRYNRTEMDTEREGWSMSDTMRKGSDNILRKLDSQKDSTEGIKRTVREGLLVLSDTLEREMKGINEKISESVRKRVEVEVAEMKDMLGRLEERVKMKEDTVNERMRKLEERVKEGEEKEITVSHKLEKTDERIRENEEKLRSLREDELSERLGKVEDSLKDTEKEKGQDNVTDRMEKMEDRINDTEDRLATMSKDKESAKVDIDKQKELEDRVKENEERMETLSQAGDKARRKESEREMKDRIEAAGKNLKYFGIDLGTGSKDRREMVNRTISHMKERVLQKDKESFRTVINRTRIRLLGKDTEERQFQGRKINTLPVLLECRTEEDKRVLEEILRKAGWHSSFEWPGESMEFIREAKKELNMLGYVERLHRMRIRPEIRDGRTKIRGEVRDKEGGRLRVVAVWEVPPTDRTLWNKNQLRPCLTWQVQDRKRS